jgi:uncharacterized protein (TIGR00369 family)
MSEFSAEDAARFLRDNFAPWLLDMEIGVERVGGGEAVLRVPASDALKRQGGTVCGQAIMALADTAMMMAVMSAVGAGTAITTLNQTTSFLRPAAAGDLLAEARVIKPGRTIVYGEVSLHTGNREKPIAHVTSSAMVLG